MKSSFAFFVLVLLSTLSNAYLVPSVELLHTRVTKGFSEFRLSSGDENERKNDGSEESFQEKIDNFLDTPFFDPKSKDNGPLLKWFADLVESDYELAEALYVGIVFVILVIGAQELLRMQLNGDAYVPFQSGAATGNRLW